MLNLISSWILVSLFAFGSGGGPTINQVKTAIRADATANPSEYGITGGTGGGFEATEITLNYSAAIGPSYSTGGGAPGSGVGQVGSVYQDTVAGDFYLKKSSGWQLLTLPGTPDLVKDGPPSQWNAEGGAAGDFLFDYKNLAYWGPYNDGDGTWGTAQYVAFTLHPLAGAPTGADGAEGDWAWSAPNGTTVRVYGPKTSSGWPTTYKQYTVSDSATSDVRFHDDVTTGCAAANDVVIYPGDGTFNNGCSPSYLTDGGYTLKKGMLFSTGETLVADRLVIGGELVATGYTTSSSAVAVTVTIAGSEVPLGNPNGIGASANGLVPSVGSSVSKSLVYGGGAGGAIQLYLKADNLADVTALTGTLTIYALP